MPEHPARIAEDDLLRDCVVAHTRRRGPGGQHRNKTDSAVVITHQPTGVQGQAAERRSQADNHRVAVRRLRINLALQVRNTELAESAPTDRWIARRHDERIACSVDHEDFPALLAESLEVVVDHQGHVAGAALQLGITPSQLVKFLQKEPRALLLVNDLRRTRGMSALTGKP